MTLKVIVVVVVWLTVGFMIGTGVNVVVVVWYTAGFMTGTGVNVVLL